MNSRVPVSIEWLESRGERPHQERAHTRVVNFYGCLLVSPEAMALEQRLVLTNLATHRSIGAVVVHQGNKRVDGWELGVELLNPAMDFWGSGIVETARLATAFSGPQFFQGKRKALKANYIIAR